MTRKNRDANLGRRFMKKGAAYGVSICLLVWLIVVILFLQYNGGFQGNITPDWDPELGSDVFVGYRIVFNRWYLGPVSVTENVLEIVHAPAFIAALATVYALNRNVTQFREGYPFGFSDGSYLYGFWFLYSLLQWAVIGAGLGKLNSLYSPPFGRKARP